MAARGEMSAAADFMGPGAIEINRYQTEIRDLVRRRFPFGQRINVTMATGQPSRYFEQLAIPTAVFSDPRALTTTAGQPQRVERPVMLKALTSQINYGLFDVEVNQQQGQFAYLEAKDLNDTVDGVLKLHDQNLWQGNDTDPILSTSTQYYGVSGQVFTGNAAVNGNTTLNVASSGSLVDAVKTQVATMANRTDFETKPSALYSSPLTLDLFDKEAKTFQLYFNEVEILPGVVVEGIPTQMGILPLIGDPAISVWPYGAQKIYTMFILSEDFVEFHYLTDPLPRVFQLGLVGNLAAQYVVVKFGAPIVIGSTYAHTALTTTR
ncbi:MAG: hypothetical protein KGL39_37310 [Patescibacteria group bacterium]|nr:hypothetical protein [Patescibacteria group bacterium]